MVKYAGALDFCISVSEFSFDSDFENESKPFLILVALLNSSVDFSFTKKTAAKRKNSEKQSADIFKDFFIVQK